MTEQPLENLLSPLDFTTAGPAETAALEHAINQCTASCDGFHHHLRMAPSVREALRNALREQLATDPDTTGLLFQNEGKRTFIGIMALAAFAAHHRDVSDELDQQAQVVGVQSGHPLLHLTPLQLLERLRAIDLAGVVSDQWERYWQGRAQGTPLSRREHALEHFLGHISASHDYALLSGVVQTERLRPVTGVLANPEWLRLDNRQLRIETPQVQGQLLAGALVFAFDDEHQRVLYQPGSQPAFSVYATRQTLTDSLLQTAGNAADQAVRYQSVDSTNAGFDSLMAELLRAHIATLDHDPGPQLQRDAEFALVLSDGLMLQRRNQVVLAAPPLPCAPINESSPTSLYDFGSRAADVPSALAAQQLQRQLAFLQPLADRQDVLAEHRDALQAARAAAGQTIGQLLSGTAWQATSTSAEPLAQLVQAHHAGLRAHARFQQLLGEIDATELSWIESMLAQGETFPGPEAMVIAAHPLLYRTQTEDQEANDERHLLEDAVVVTHRAALDRSNTDHALLLYWPGEHGGLLRCASREVLERCLGVSAASGVAVGLSPVQGDALNHILLYHLDRTRRAAAAEQDDAQANHKEALSLCLQVPHHAAREAALDILQQESDAASLAAALPDWLARTSQENRRTLRDGLESFIRAMHQAQELLARDLPHRSLFCWQRINRRLVQDFDGYDGTPITLALPRSVSRRRDPIVGSGAPGVPVREVLVPSAAREVWSLEDLLLENLDEDMTQRLGFLSVHCLIADEHVRQALVTGIDKAYLQALASELDLAQAYEDCILATYRGLADNLFTTQYRRECLVEPWRVMLRLHASLALAKGKLSSDGEAILEIAIDANSAEHFRAKGHDIRLMGVLLSAGGADTGGASASLAGVTFVNDQNSGITLLCLPEHPDQPLAQFTSLEAARLSLYEMAKQSSGLDYLAGRALLGNPEAHRARLRQALDRRFDAIVAVGSVWPTQTSLAHHLLDAQMGRVIAAHRATSRSNRDLWLENFAYQSGMVFNYLKMAFGFVPVVGTVIGLYDFFDATYSAAKALLEGEGERALAELERALLAFIDAAMDLAPGVGAGINISAARRLARQRQANLPQLSIRQFERRLARFAGYEYPDSLSLTGVHPGNTGRFAGIYRHVEGDFILVGDRPCKVQWDASAHTWRLAGTPRKGWKRAVAMDSRGRWDTHFALYGTHLQGGGAGGGQALGHLAEQLDPYWPAAIRERLPRFWTDRLYRHQRTLYSQTATQERQLQASLARSNDLYERFSLASEQDKTGMVDELERLCIADIEHGKRLYDTWHAYQQVSTGRRRQVPLLQKARAGTVVGDRLVHLLGLKLRRSKRRLAEMGAIVQVIQHTGDPAQQLPWFRELRQRAIAHLDEREQMYDAAGQLQTWHTRGESTSILRQVHDRYSRTLNAEFREYFNTQHLMCAAQRFEDASPGPAFLRQRLHEDQNQTIQAVSTLAGLQEVQASAPQRRQIQEQVRIAYLGYKRRLQSTQASAPTLFDSVYLQRLYENLDALIARAERTIRRTPSGDRTVHGPSSPRLFQTVEGQLYIGDYVPVSANHPGYMIIRGDTGAEIGRYVSVGEHWQRQIASRPANPYEVAGLQAAASRLVADLESYRARIEVYQRQGMLPADVEHMMVIKAEDLESCARRLGELDSASAEPAQLLVHARELRKQGKAMRALQVKRSTQPNEGQLTYLIQERQVEIQRLQGRRELKPGDYLEEYAVLDLSDPARTPLWYVHFHYRDLQTPVDQYSAAHLKLAADRYHGAEWQAGQAAQSPIWRGAISRAVAQTLFANL